MLCGAFFNTDGTERGAYHAFLIAAVAAATVGALIAAVAICLRGRAKVALGDLSIGFVLNSAVLVGAIILGAITARLIV